jgi:branched-chain amino acid transport system ATP-binding protein
MSKKEEPKTKENSRALSWRDGPEETYCLRLEQVSKFFGGLQAVRSVSLEIGLGERRAIIGPNGAGKTTLFNLIAGNYSISRGKVLFLGEDITGLPCHQRARRGIARTYQITNLFPNLSVIENMILAVQALQRTKLNLWRPLSRYRGLYERGMELLSDMGIEKYQGEVVKNLSYGVQRQIEIMLALAGTPSLLLLDEPTAGLSPGEADTMVKVLKKLPSSISIIIIEHDMQVAFQLADRITVLHFGEIIGEGTVEEIRENAAVQEIYLGKGGSVPAHVES